MDSHFPGADAIAYTRKLSELTNRLRDLLNDPPEGVIVRFTHTEMDRTAISGPIRFDHHLTVHCYRQLPTDIEETRA